MARVTYQASTDNKQWSPNLTEDDSNRILKQSQDYIEKLKAARDFEASQDAEFIREYTGGIRRGIESQRQVDQEQERQLRALATYKQGLLRENAQRSRSMGSASGGGSNTQKWLDFAVNASTTAAQTFGKIQKINADADIQFAEEYTARNPVSFKQIGDDYQSKSTDILGVRMSAGASIAESNGDPELANNLRSMRPGRAAQVRRIQSTALGRQMPSFFQRDIYSQESKMEVLIDGERRPLNTVRTSDEMRQAYPQYRKASMEANGFNDLGNKLYTDLFVESEKGFQQVIGDTRRKELSASKNNDLDQASAEFNVVAQDPNKAQAAVMDYYMTEFFHSGGDRKAARQATNKKFNDPSVPEESFIAYQQTVLPGMTKSIGELYPDEIREIRQARLGESQQVQNEFDVQQQMESTQEARRVTEARLADVADDNDVDLSPQAVKEQIEKYTRLGPNYTEALNAWKGLVPELSSTKRDEELTEQFQDLSDRGALSDDFIMRSDGSEELKRKWLKQSSATAEQGVPEAALSDFKGIANAMLMDRSGETPGASGSSNNAHTKRALRRAMDDYRKDFVVKLRDGSTASEAAQYAEGRFNERFSSETGLYKTTDFTEYEDGKKITVGRYSGFGPQSTAAIEEPQIQLNKDIEKHGSSVYDQPDIVPLATLQRVQKSMSENKRIMIPPAIVTMADSSGGKLSVMDVLNRQLKANGLDQINPDVFNTAKEAQDVVSPEWQQRLNYKPTYESTDAAMIGSGQEPIYDQRIPTNIKSDVPFQQAVAGLSQRLGVSASDLFAVMDFETGGTFDPAIRNAAGSGATGLIQIMPSTAAGLGTTTEALASMSRIEQLEYVEKYLVRAGVKPGHGISDLYMSVLFPAAVGKSDDFILFGSGAMSDYQGNAYTQNRGLDSNGDGSVTKAEATAKVLGSANVWRQTRNLNPALVARGATTPTPQAPTAPPELLTRTKEEGPGSGDWKWDEKRQLFVKIN